MRKVSITSQAVILGAVEANKVAERAPCPHDMMHSWGGPASALIALLAAAASPAAGFFVRGPQSFSPGRIYLRQRNAGYSSATPAAAAPASSSIAKAAAACRTHARLSSQVYSAGMRVRAGN